MFFFRLLFTLLTFLFFFPRRSWTSSAVLIRCNGKQNRTRNFRTVLFLLGDIRTDLGAPIQFIAFWTAARISASSPENSRYIFLDSPSSLRRYHKLISCLATEVFDLFFLHFFLELFLETTETLVKEAYAGMLRTDSCCSSSFLDISRAFFVWKEEPQD